MMKSLFTENTSKRQIKGNPKQIKMMDQNLHRTPYEKLEAFQGTDNALAMNKDKYFKLAELSQI